MGLVNVYAGNERAARAARSTINLNGVNFLAKFGKHVACVFKISDEGSGVSGEDVASIEAAEGEDLLDFSIMLDVLIDHRAANGSAFTFNAGHFLDRRGLCEVIQVFVVFDVQLVEDVHVVSPFVWLVHK